MTELVRYDAMCRAIIEAHKIDEVKDIRDKALAIQAYARQAKNHSAEAQAREIRIRAERRCGQFLQELKTAGGIAKGGKPYHAVNRTGYTAEPVDGTLASWKITKKQSHEWQQVADVPEEVFERELKTQDEPSAATIVHAHAPKTTPVPKVTSEALWLWGRLRDFERDGFLEQAQSDILLTMTESMLDDVRRLAPLVAAWLAGIEKEAPDVERRSATA